MASSFGFFSSFILNANRFSCETEFRKVTWPTKEETVRSTTVVVLFTIIVAGALAGYDWIWGEVTSRVLFTEI